MTRLHWERQDPWTGAYNTAETFAVVQATGNGGEAALRETGSINRSLFTLGQVLAGLSMRRTSFRSDITAFILLSHEHAMCVRSLLSFLMKQH